MARKIKETAGETCETPAIDIASEAVPKTDHSETQDDLWAQVQSINDELIARREALRQHVRSEEIAMSEIASRLKAAEDRHRGLR